MKQNKLDLVNQKGQKSTNKTYNISNKKRTNK